MADNVKVKILYFLTGIPDASAAISSSLMAKIALPCRDLKISLDFVFRQKNLCLRPLHPKASVNYWQWKQILSLYLKL